MRRGNRAGDAAPVDDVAPAFRLHSGRPGAMHFEGQRLRVGEVVNLSRTQYEAWKDRFSPIDAEITEEAEVTS